MNVCDDEFDPEFESHCLPCTLEPSDRATGCNSDGDGVDNGPASDDSVFDSCANNKDDVVRR